MALLKPIVKTLNMSVKLGIYHIDFDGCNLRLIRRQEAMRELNDKVMQSSGGIDDNL
jgi:hypothetical protein